MAGLVMDAEYALNALGMNPQLLESLTPALERAIASAQEKLASAWGVKSLAAEHREDTFHLDPTAHHGMTMNGMFRLLLANGLVHAETVEVVVADDWRFSSGVTSLASSDFLVDDERGVVRVEDTIATQGKFVKVNYHSGQDSTHFHFWVMEAVSALLNTTFAVNQPQDKSNAEMGLYTKSTDYALSLLNTPHRSRIIDLTYLPMNTQQVPD